MTIQRAKSISDLYQEVSDYDLVITVDAPLSLALNRRIDTPRLGRFAVTPRMLASGEFRPHDDRKLFFELIEHTDLSWKRANYALETILGCWEETGTLDGILEYERFDTPETRAALSVLQGAESAHHDLSSYVIDPDLSVAVIGVEQFTTLDKSVLPPDYDTINPLESGTFDMPDFRVFDSATAITETLVENISPANASNIAVIMDQGSEYPSLVESAFEAEGVPYHGGPGFTENEGVRTCLRLIRSAYCGSDLRLEDVRPVLTYLGINSDVTDDQKRFHEIDEPELKPIQKFCQSISARTFDDVLKAVENWGNCALKEFRDELELLGLRDKPVTEARLNELEFYLQSYEIPVERDDSGVLLADPKSAAYVDRPTVFYLGMNSGWTHQIPDRPWIDSAERDRQNLQQFQLLLQNGAEQYYLVQNTAGGEPITPCLYFHDLLDTDFETFGDLPFVTHSRFTRRGRVGFDRAEVEADLKTIQTLSPSSLNTLANSPRDYFFDQIVKSADRDYFRKGTLYHDFAEFYVNHPSVVHSTDTTELVELMLEEMRPFVNDVQLDVLETEFEVGISIIETFLEESPPTEREYDNYDPDDSENLFAAYFDRPLDSDVTERWFENPELGTKGKIDLVHDPARLLDYKSGGLNSASSVVKQSSTEPISDDPNFQAILYLTQHRQAHPDQQLEFVFFHFLEILDEALSGEAAVEDALVRITYHPMSFVEYAGTREAFDALCAGVAESNDRRKTLERMEYDAYESFFDQHTIPDTDDPDELLDSEFADKFTTFAISEVGDYQYVKDGTDSALKKLLKVRSRQYFKDELDAFERFLDEQIELVNEYRRTTFPVGEPNDDRLNNPDLIRTDD